MSYLGWKLFISYWVMAFIIQSIHLFIKIKDGKFESVQNIIIMAQYSSTPIRIMFFIGLFIGFTVVAFFTFPFHMGSVIIETFRKNK